MEGLAQAARSFDPARGVMFDRYASRRIRGALLDELRRGDWATRSVRSKARKVNNAADSLMARLGRVPTAAEIAEAAHMDEEGVVAIAQDVHRAVVLNFEALVGGGEDVLASDTASDASPDAVILERERRAYLFDAVATLPERLRRVVIGYFFEELPMQQIADELGVTESRISQMRSEALVLLKDGMNSQLEPDLMENGRKPSTRITRRRAAYHSAIAHRSDYKARLSHQPAPLAALA
jgi:RNA polymerase sigma factor for flagellar operon FliA